MKYIDFESWTITWLHEGSVIVEDQLTHNFKRGSRTAPPKAVSWITYYLDRQLGFQKTDVAGTVTSADHVLFLQYKTNIQHISGSSAEPTP